MVAVDSGEGPGKTGKKKEKKGFKCDRYDRYQKKRLREMGVHVHEEKKGKDAQKGSVVKEVKFDDSSRREFLLSFHKKKNERRVSAFVDAKKKVKKENAKFRREQREEARKAYNTYAKVPILPDYTFRLPDVDAAADPEEEEHHEDSEGSEGEGDRLAKSSRSKTFFSQKDSLFGDDVEGVTVTVQPLRNSSNAGSGRGTLPINDFTDLPEAVAQELKRLRQAEKGPAKTKAKVHTLKELEKIRKIRKHSRKGHGKKGSKGKKRNR